MCSLRENFAIKLSVQNTNSGVIKKEKESEHKKKTQFLCE